MVRRVRVRTGGRVRTYTPCGASARGTHVRPRPRPWHANDARTVAARRGKPPCASGTCGTQEAGARTPYVQQRRPRGARYVSAWWLTGIVEAEDEDAHLEGPRARGSVTLGRHRSAASSTPPLRPIRRVVGPSGGRAGFWSGGWPRACGAHLLVAQQRVEQLGDQRAHGRSLRACQREEGARALTSAFAAVGAGRGAGGGRGLRRRGAGGRWWWWDGRERSLGHGGKAKGHGDVHTRALERSGARCAGVCKATLSWQ